MGKVILGLLGALGVAAVAGALLMLDHGRSKVPRHEAKTEDATTQLPVRVVEQSQPIVVPERWPSIESTSLPTGTTNLPGELGDGGATSRLVVANAKGGLIVYGGTVATKLDGLRQSTGREPMAVPYLDAPGSIWIIADGGATWKGRALNAGQIYHVEDNGELRLASEVYFARVKSKSSRTVYGSPMGNGSPIAVLDPDEAVRLLVPAKHQDGAHRVKLSGNSEVEGYIRGAWDNLAFYKIRPDTASADEQVGRARDLILGEWFGRYASKRSNGELEEWDETYKFEPDGVCHRVLTLHGIRVQMSSSYQIQGIDTLVTQPEGMVEKTIWRMSVDSDSLVLAHSTDPEPGAIGKGTSRLSRERKIARGSFEGVRESPAHDAPTVPFGDVEMGTRFYFPNDVERENLWVKKSETVANNLKNGRSARIPGIAWVILAEYSPQDTAAIQGSARGRAGSLLPGFSSSLNGGRNTLSIRNPNDYDALVGLRSGNAGMNFTVKARSIGSVDVPDANYDVFFQFSDRPNSLFQGDRFTLAGNIAEIQLVAVPAGNYGLREVH